MNSKKDPFLLTYVISYGTTITTRCSMAELRTDLCLQECEAIEEWFSHNTAFYPGLGKITKLKFNPRTLNVEQVTIDTREIL